MKVLAVVSGGDAPGINAALWHFTRLAAEQGDHVLGADGGLPAAVDGDHVNLTPTLLAPHVSLGGSLIASSREPILKQETARQRFADRLRREAIDGVLLFGGDGTLTHVPPLLNALGVACIALPTTIDNDIPGTDYTLGFDTACNFAYASIDGALATARALRGRIFTVETLGGFTGHIALAVGHAVGAHAVLVPEIAFDLDWLVERVRRAMAAEGCALIVHSEGIPDARTLPERLAAAVGIRVRDVRLGHAQRGGSPTHRDRTFAADLATAAFDGFKRGTRRAALLSHRGALSAYDGPLTDFPARHIDHDLYARVNGITAS